MINRQPLSEQLRLDPGRARFLMEPIFDPRVIQTDPELRRFLQYLRTDIPTFPGPRVEYIKHDINYLVKVSKMVLLECALILENEDYDVKALIPDIGSTLFLYSRTLPGIDEIFEPGTFRPVCSLFDYIVSFAIETKVIHMNSDMVPRITDRGLQVLSMECHEYYPLEKDYKFHPEAVVEFLNMVLSMNPDELMLYFITDYPDLIRSSLHRHIVEKKRRSIAASVYKKEIVSLEKGAEMAGECIETFLQYIQAQSYL